MNHMLAVCMLNKSPGQFDLVEDTIWTKPQAPTKQSWILPLLARTSEIMHEVLYIANGGAKTTNLSQMSDFEPLYPD
jgi:hypothetical protein